MTTNTNYNNFCLCCVINPMPFSDTVYKYVNACFAKKKKKLSHCSLYFGVTYIHLYINIGYSHVIICSCNGQESEIQLMSIKYCQLYLL